MAKLPSDYLECATATNTKRFEKLFYTTRSPIPQANPALPSVWQNKLVVFVGKLDSANAHVSNMPTSVRRANQRSSGGTIQVSNRPRSDTVTRLGASVDMTRNTRVAQLVEHSPEEPQNSGGRAGGSNPSPRINFHIGWREELHCLRGVYVRRWYLETPWFSVRLHHWLHSDDSRYFHDHPFSFVTLVLWGSYIDRTPAGDEFLGLGSVRYRNAFHRHSVIIPPGGAWTALLTGPKVRRWGFWVRDKFKKSNKYFLEHGQHICD
jgi:hypothetical protein